MVLGRQGPRELPNPRGGQILKAIFWGRGMKRWHCGSGYVVAHIDLYDITNLPSDVLDHALDGGVAIDQTPLPSSAIFGYGRIENTYKIPLVEFTQTDGSSFFRGRKPRNLEVLAPETQVRGTDNEEAMDWEIYRAADNTKTIYQVNTVGGAEPPECHSKFGQEIEVYFTAQYWVYDSHSSPGITRDQQPEDVCRFKTTYDAPVTNDWQVVGANL